MGFVLWVGCAETGGAMKTLNGYCGVSLIVSLR
jgi:hypothetical protein